MKRGHSSRIGLNRVNECNGDLSPVMADLPDQPVPTNRSPPTFSIMKNQRRTLRW
jgi:hypothetical protein